MSAGTIRTAANNRIRWNGFSKSGAGNTVC